MREIVIVIADLYLPPGSTEVGDASYAATAQPSGFASDASAAGTVGTSSPGPLALEHVARFGQRRTLDAEGGWRAWLARRLGREDLANVPPAVIATAAFDPWPPSAPLEPRPSAAATTASAETASLAPTARSAALSSTAWFATPLHRIAGLTTLHLDRRGILHLSAADAEGFVLDFNRTFGNDPTSPLHLHDVPGASLLLQAPANLMAMTTEPARALVRGLEDSMPQGTQANAFKRLSAEVEMWLHDHPLNTFRIKRGDLPVNAFWFWGGGPLESRPQRAPPHATRALRLFGADPYLPGLAGLTGGTFLNALPKVFPDVANTQRTVFLTQINPLLHAHPTASVFDAVAEIDRRFITPALAAIQAGAAESLTLVVNDIELTVRRHDRWKFWRRFKPILTGIS